MESTSSSARRLVQARRSSALATFSMTTPTAARRGGGTYRAEKLVPYAVNEEHEGGRHADKRSLATPRLACPRDDEAGLDREGVTRLADRPPETPTTSGSEGLRWRRSPERGPWTVSTTSALSIPWRYTGGDAEVRVLELALADDQRDAFVGHLHRVRVAQLVRREPSLRPPSTCQRSGHRSHNTDSMNPPFGRSLTMRQANPMSRAASRAWQWSRRARALSRCGSARGGLRPRWSRDRGTAMQGPARHVCVPCLGLEGATLALPGTPSRVSLVTR
jgi:hypothetical protein